MKKLGCLQQQMLHSLKEHGSWYRGCGWVWDIPSHTEKILSGSAIVPQATRTESK